MKKQIYLYELCEDGTSFSYDESLAVACMQGLFNRDGAHIYVTSRDDDEHRNGAPGAGSTGFGAPYNRVRCTPYYWLDKFSEKGNWLSDYEKISVNGLDELFDITKSVVKGFVIWDVNVPATVNVATTIAGVENLIALSSDLYESFGKKTGLPIICDLRGRFDGSGTGSAKVDAYRWAIENYLKKGLCSGTIVGQYNDSWGNRENGYVSYVLERDRLIAEKAFTFDLSPWDYFAPEDDKEQPLGLEKETMLLIFKTVYDNVGGKNMTEFCGFFNAKKLMKGQENGVLSEWEQVYLMSPYNFYQNTVANDVYNQSFHKWAPIGELKQHRPIEKKTIENKVYMCIQICDMDSTTPLYDSMINLWNDPRRGELPLAWGINPNLSGIYPDIFEHFYNTASENDYFCADASAAGYFNPSCIQSKHWNMVCEHNKYWFKHTDMTIAGMVLDGDHPTTEVLKNYAAFAPDGFASLISGFHGGKNIRPSDQIFDDMPFSHMTIGVCDWLGSTEKTAAALNDCYFKKFANKKPEFVYYRICYRFPSEMFDLYREIQKTNPDLTIELVDPYTYFDLIKQNCIANQGLDPQIGSSK